MTKKTRAALQTDVNTYITTNLRGDIDGVDVRNILIDVLDSCPASGEIPLFTTTILNSGVAFVTNEGAFRTQNTFMYNSGVASLILTSGLYTAPSGDLLSVQGRSRLDATYCTPLNDSVGAATTAVNIDLSFSNHHELTLNSNKTLSFLNGKPGQRFILRVTQGGSFTITWPTVSWASQTAPTLSSSGYSDVFGFLITSTGTVDAFVIGQGH